MKIMQISADSQKKTRADRLASYQQVKGATKMTNEEAIKHLETYSSTMGSGLTTQEQHEEAKKMAIEALKRGPYFTISFDDDKLRELCQRAAEKLKEQFVNEGAWQIMEKGDFIAVCKSDFPLTEEVKNELKDTVFISDEPRYCFEMTEIIKANKAANQKSKREEAADDGEQ